MAVVEGSLSRFVLQYIYGMHRPVCGLRQAGASALEVAPGHGSRGWRKTVEDALSVSLRTERIAVGEGPSMTHSARLNHTKLVGEERENRRTT